MYFTVEEENMIGMYHKSDRRRTAGAIQAVLPEVNEDMAALARQSLDKLEAPWRRSGSISQANNPSRQKRRARGLYSPCVRRFFSRVIPIHPVLIHQT